MSDVHLMCEVCAIEGQSQAATHQYHLHVAPKAPPILLCENHTTKFRDFAGTLDKLEEHTS